MALKLLTTFFVTLLTILACGDLTAANSWELCDGFNPKLGVEDQAKAFEEIIRNTSNTSLIEAEENCTCFLDYAVSQSDSAVIQSAYILLGNIQFKNHKTEESLKNLKQAYNIAEKRGDQTGMMKSQRLMAISYHFLDERKKSKQSFFTALRLSEELGDTAVTAQILLNLGLISTMVNDYQEALVFYQKALDLSVIFKDPVKKCTVMQGLAIAYKGLNDIPNAMVYCRNALNLVRTLDNNFLEATITYSAGEIWQGQDDSAAISYYKRALDLYTQLEANSQILRVTLDYAEFLTDLGKPYEGIALLEPAVLNNELTKGVNVDPDWYFALGYLYFKTNDFEKAESIVKVGLSSSNELPVAFLEKSNYLLGQIYHERKEFEMASRYFQEAKVFADSVTKLTKEDQLAELRIKYNTQNNKKALENLIELNKIREEQKAQNKNYFILLIVLFVIAVFVAVFLGKQAKFRTIQSKKLEHQIVVNAKKREDLIQANQKAKEGLRVKSEFISTISHEVRTPLTAILGMTNLVMNTKIDAIQKGYLNSIHISGKNLLVLVNDILDFSKQEQNKLILKKAPIKLQDVLDEVVSGYDPLIQDKGLKFQVTLDPNLPKMVIVDSSRIKQVIFNLLNNALKFTEKGFVLFEVSVLDDGIDRTCIRFKVSDTGVGIPKENQLEIFEPFNQVESNHTRRYAGTGIGLTISNAILKQMNSSIEVSSTKGEGSSFWFDLRVEKTKVTSLNRNPNWVSNKMLDSSLAKKCPWKILVVEDNPINQRLLQVNLQQMGYVPVLSDNGEEALNVLKDTSVDLIFMDIQMPVMDGITATQEIVKVYRDTKPVIVALTANAMGHDKEEYLNAGMDDYISKPYMPAQIEQCIKKWHAQNGESVPV